MYLNEKSFEGANGVSGGEAAYGSARSLNRSPAEPPTCNTGALSAKVTLDHLAFTVNVSTVSEVQTKLGGQWEQGKGWRGYQNMWTRREGEAVTMMGANMRGCPGQIHVQLAGAASKALPFGAVQSLFQWVKIKQGHVSRADVALDDYTGLLNLDVIEQALEAGKMVTRSKEYSVMKSGDLRTGKVGKTIAIGSPNSLTRHVIYDKAVEQTKKGKPYEGHWVRLETRYQDERADLMMSMLCGAEEKNLFMVVMGYLVAALDFRDITPEMSSWEKSRADRLPWWQEFTDSIKGVRLTIQKVVQSIEKTAEWVSHSLAPMLAVVVANKRLGWIWLEQEIERGKQSWNERHRALSVAGMPAMGGGY